MKKTINFKALILWLAIGFSVGWLGNDALRSDAIGGVISINNESQEESADLTLFWEVWNTLTNQYVDTAKLNVQSQIYGAIAGMVNALGDPYTVFMTPEETESFHQSLEGELEGIGAELTVKEGILVVISPLKGSPAEKAGLLPGDYVYMVDGKPTTDMTLFEAIKAIRGEKGTQVTLTILRKDINEPFEVKITREKIDVPSVELSYKEVGEKNLALLSINQFGDSTSAEFKKSVNDILLNQVDGLVVDLRLNGGGYLESSIEILSEFFDDEVAGVTVKRRDNKNETLKTKGNGKLPELPMVVLINEGSASASEILAGAIQDYKRGIVMGVKSYGKGSVQELSPFQDGSTLRLTIAKWYTPNDRSIDHTGITPDIVVEMETSKIETEEDVQMQSAIDYLADL